MQDYRARQFATLFSDGVEAEAPSSPVERRRRRAETLRQSAGRGFARICADLNHVLSPRALLGLPSTVDFIIREKGIGVADLPDPRRVRRVPDGLAGLATDLSPPVLVDAYSRGLFLRWMLGQAAYWAPQIRMLARPIDVASAPSANMRELIAQGRYRITLDREFDSVVSAATEAAIRRRAPYSPTAAGMMAFANLHDAGFAHSVEIRDRDGVLAGGLYGVACGRIFVLQARFAQTPDVADLAVVALARHLASWGYDLMDGCADAALGALSFAETLREEHIAMLPRSLCGGRPGRWLVVPSLLDQPDFENAAM